MQEFSMGKLLEKKELAAIALVFFTVAGLLNFPARATLPGFSEAILVQNALLGKAAPAHSQLASQLVPVLSPLLGAQSGSPDSIVAVLLLLPPLFLAISAVFIYLSLRVAGHRRTVSAFFALLVSFLLSSWFLPGVWGPAQAAAPLFALFLLHMSLYSAGKKQFALAIAAIFAAASAFLYPSSALAGAAVCIPLAISGASADGKGGKQFLSLLPVAAFAIAAFLSPSAATFGASLANLQSALFNFSLLLAFASLAVAVFFTARTAGPSEHAISALLGFLSFAACPPLSAMALCMPSAFGLDAASSEKISKLAKLACAFVFGFFAVFALVYSGGDAIRAAAIAFMVATLFPLLMYFYNFQNGKAFALLSLCSLAFAISLFAFAQFSAGAFGHVYYSDPGFSSALSSLSGTGGQIYMIGNQEMAKFYTPSAAFGAQDDFLAFLASGKPRLASGSYLILSPDYFDSGNWPSEGTAFSAYQFSSNTLAKDGSSYAIFASISSGLLRQLDSTGAFALRDGSLLDSSGRQYYTVPYSRMILLNSNLSYQSQANRLIVVEDGSLPPYFLKIYAGSASGVSKMRDFGQVSVYKVD